MHLQAKAKLSWPQGPWQPGLGAARSEALASAATDGACPGRVLTGKRTGVGCRDFTRLCQCRRLATVHHLHGPGPEKGLHHLTGFFGRPEQSARELPSMVQYCRQKNRILNACRNTEAPQRNGCVK